MGLCYRIPVLCRRRPLSTNVPLIRNEGCPYYATKQPTQGAYRSRVFSRFDFFPIAETVARLRGLVQDVLSPVDLTQIIPRLDCFQGLGIKRYTLGGSEPGNVAGGGTAG